jgi:hypothetical protein
MTADPFDGHNPVTLLSLVLLCLLLAAGLAVYGFVTMARHGIRRSDMGTTLRYLAALAASGAIAVYAWGALHLLAFDETMRDQACKNAVGPDHAMHIDRYEPSYLPLSLGCHVKGGGTYSVGVPAYINPALVGLAVIAITLAVFAALESERRARHVARKEAHT